MDYRNLRDDDLVAQCRSQLPYNTEAFAALVTRYEPRVFDMCVRYLGNAADAEEVTQNVFMKVFRGLGKFESRAAFRTWLYRITNNECASKYRTMKRRSDAHAVYVDSIVASVDFNATANRQQQQAPELAGPLGDAWRSLSERDRAVLSLRHIAELPIAEAAEALGLGLSAAKMRLYRAEERLRSAYLEARAADRHPSAGPA